VDTRVVIEPEPVDGWRKIVKEGSPMSWTEANVTFFEVTKILGPREGDV